MHLPRVRPGTPTSPPPQTSYEQRHGNLQQGASPQSSSEQSNKQPGSFHTMQSGSLTPDSSNSNGRRRVTRNRLFVVALVFTAVAAMCTTAFLTLPQGATHRSITLAALNWLRVPDWLQPENSHESGACAMMTAAQCDCCRSTNTTCVNARCAQLLLPTPASRNLSCRVIFNNAPQRHDADTQGTGPGYGQQEADYLHIPVLGVPLVSDPKLYLLRWLYSIDLPVHHLVIVTGGNGRQVAAQLDHIADHARNVTVIQCDDFVSVSQGWNLILSTFFDEAPWYVISAHDVQFAPGSLATLARRFRDDIQKGIDFAHIGWANKHDVHNYGRLLMRAGLFDENIYPTFYEDDEFEIRTQQKLHPPAESAVYEDVKAVHGKLSDSSFTSGTTRIEEGAVNDRIQKGKRMNAHYVARKWGCGEVLGPDQYGWFKFNRSVCSNPTPFNRSSRVWEWDVDLNLRGFSMAGLAAPVEAS